MMKYDFLCSISGQVSILYPLKISENFWNFGILRGCKMGALARKGLMWKPIHKNATVLESPKILIKIKEDPILMKKKFMKIQ